MIEKRKKIIKKNNFISILALLSLFFLLLTGTYFSISVLTEMKISDSYIKSSQGYYLAEAGINEAIWKLRNDTSTADGDQAWKTQFVTNPGCATFTDSFVRQNNLLPDSSYTVTITNSECARGEIIVIAEINLPGGSTVQRVIKTKVFKAQNPSPIADSAVFTGGPSENITMLAGYMNLYKGNIFSNNDLIVQLISTLNVYDNPATPQQEGQVLVVKNLNKSIWSTINAEGGICEKQSNPCPATCAKCPPDAVTMPMIDFDSADPNSYKSRAQSAGTVYTSTQFENMLWNNPNLTLNNDVTYVTGTIELKGNRRLTVNGLLVADGTITVGESLCWIKGFPWPCGNSQLTVNHTTGKASGLLSKGKLNFGLFANQINVTGLLYANDQFNLTSLPQSFNITGGMIARKISLVSVWQALNITLDNAIISEAVGLPTYSPIVQIDHWEETY